MSAETVYYASVTRVRDCSQQPDGTAAKRGHNEGQEVGICQSGQFVPKSEIRTRVRGCHGQPDGTLAKRGSGIGQQHGTCQGGEFSPD